MAGIYYAELLDVLRAAGLTCQESSTTNGWQQRSRSSGGFPAPPLCVFWHHTASSTSPANDLSYMINGSSDKPVGNMLIDRGGVCWPIAAGASNCAGKGGPSSFSRGTIPKDSGNTYGWQIEVANNGVGEAWPQVQVDAFFKASNALNAHFGNLPTDVITHSLGAGNGYTNRKIDTATAAAVQGPWKPRSCSSSGTWHLDDIRSECSRRAGSAPPSPTPTPPSPTPSPTPPWPDPTGDDDDMASAILQASDDPKGPYFWWDGRKIGAVRSNTQVDVGRVVKVYSNPSSTPLTNFTKAQLRDMIASGWDDVNAPPSGYS